MRQMRIKPVAGKKIRDPKDGRPLMAERTMVVPCTSYWKRRLRDGDIVEVKAQVVEKPKPKPKQKVEKTEKKEEKKEKPL